VIKISISGNSSELVKNDLINHITMALGPFTEQYPNEDVKINLRKGREQKIEIAAGGQ
jgi:hypothetical protein